MGAWGIVTRFILVAALAATNVALVGATPAAPKEPIHVTFHAHGDTSIGEAEVHDALRGAYMTMDRRPPTSDVPKSVGLTNVGGAPNTNCAGSPYFPVWVGKLGGRITGDVTFRFNVVSSTGGRVEIRIWNDMDIAGCDEDYREPSAVTSVALPEGSGQVVAVIEDVDVEAATNIMLQVTPLNPGVTQGRILYDARDADAVLSFDCTPLWGDTCAPYE